MVFKKSLIFLSFLLVGCSSPLPQKVWIDELIDIGSVTSDTIKQEGIKVIGSTKDSYSDLSNYEVIELNSVVKSMFILKFKNKNLQNTDKAPRFDLTYTILGNNTFHSKDETEESICYKTYREMKIRLHILDNTTKADAWGGVINKKTYQNNCNPKFNSENESFVGFFFETIFNSVAEAAVDKKVGTYPEAPSVNSTSKKIFHDFIESLPFHSIKT